ncbi:MAG TPA: dihydrofolate reductase family protein [Acidimicrobiia bacterium]|nr:dihydrofolate reductase family protein [Acidimicrobiia bacterium]
MGKIEANFFISLDGVVESPDQWHFPYFNDEMGAVIDSGVSRYAAFLMGRTLYGEWSEYWPKEDADAPPGEPVEAANTFASFINNVPKYVVSSSLDTAAWKNTTIVSGDVPARIRTLKEQTDGDIGMSGSATLARWLLANGLLDELHLLIHPIVVGHGARLFGDTPTVPLELVDQQTFKTGVLDVIYAPAAG